MLQRFTGQENNIVIVSTSIINNITSIIINIMPRESTFNLIPENLFSRKSCVNKDFWQATVSKKYGFITFSKKYVEQRGLYGKFIKFYADTDKNIIAWRVFTTGGLDDIKNYRQLKKNEYDLYKFSISSIINSLKLKDESYKGLIVKQYNTTYSHLEGVVSYDYVKVD